MRIAAYEYAMEDHEFNSTEEVDELLSIIKQNNEAYRPLLNEGEETEVFEKYIAQLD